MVYSKVYFSVNRKRLILVKSSGNKTYQLIQQLGIYKLKGIFGSPHPDPPDRNSQSLITSHILCLSKAAQIPRRSVVRHADLCIIFQCLCTQAANHSNRNQRVTILGGGLNPFEFASALQNACESHWIAQWHIGKSVPQGPDRRQRRRWGRGTAFRGT